MFNSTVNYVRKTSLVILASTMALALTARAELPLGRIVVSADGNRHDRDDILATACTLAILSKSGAGPQTRVYVYADHVWSTSTSREAKMKESTEGSVALYGDFPNLEIYSGFHQTNAAIDAIAAQINQSTASDPLWIIGAGPMHIIGKAIEAANSNKHKHVTIITHSDANNRHAEKDGHDGIDLPDIIADFPTVNVDQIPDQNGNSSNPRFEVETSDVQWIANSTDPKIQWLWERFIASEKNEFDGSDCGMAWYLTQDFDYNGTYDKLRVLLESSDPTPDPTGMVTLEFEPTDDAYLQGSKLFNNEILRVDYDNKDRVSYLKFDVSGIDGVVTGVKLELTQSDDDGDGVFNFYKGSSSSWTEKNLSSANAPGAEALMGTFKGNINKGKTISVDMGTLVESDGKVTVIIEQGNGNDVAFSSKEGKSAPKLIVELEQSALDERIRKINAGAPNDNSFSGSSSTFSVGDAVKIDTKGSGLLSARHYRSERYGKNFKYTFTGLEPDKAYKLCLHFAEIWFNESGKRVFNVSVNGSRLLDDYDVYAVAGGKNIAVKEEILVYANANGEVIVDFSASVNNAKISAIELYQ